MVVFQLSHMFKIYIYEVKDRLECKCWPTSGKVLLFLGRYKGKI